MSEPMHTSRFLDDLASAAPTPGGGGAAAVMAAMGAALISMVANLTIGKKGFEAVEGDMQLLLGESEALRLRAQAMVEDDARAFDRLMASYKLPKASDAEKAARSAAIQVSLKSATGAPLACAHAAAEGVRLAARAVEHGNPNVISDVGVGVLASVAALRSAALNVRINAPQIKDRDFAERALTEIEWLLNECVSLAERIHERVTARLG